MCGGKGSFLQPITWHACKSLPSCLCLVSTISPWTHTKLFTSALCICMHIGINKYVGCMNTFITQTHALLLVSQGWITRAVICLSHYPYLITATMRKYIIEYINVTVSEELPLQRKWYTCWDYENVWGGSWLRTWQVLLLCFALCRNTDILWTVESLFSILCFGSFASA